MLLWVSLIYVPPLKPWENSWWLQPFINSIMVGLVRQCLKFFNKLFCTEKSITHLSSFKLVLTCQTQTPKPSPAPKLLLSCWHVPVCNNCLHWFHCIVPNHTHIINRRNASNHSMYHMKSTGIIFACHAFYLVTSSGIVQIINASDVQQAVDTGLALVQTPWPCTKSFPPGLCSHPRPKDTDKNEDILPNSQLLKENNNKVELMLKLIILQPTAIISWCFNLLTKPQTYQIFIKSTILLPQPSIYHHSHTMIIMILIDTLKHFLKLEIWTPLIRTEELKVCLLYLFRDICFPFVSIYAFLFFPFTFCLIIWNYNDEPHIKLAMYFCD